MNPSNRNPNPIGSGSTRSKPRLVKLRKHTAPATGNVDPRFNPFCSSSGHNLGPPNLNKSSFGTDGFVFGAKMGTESRFVDHNSVVDSMMKLKIDIKNISVVDSNEAGNSGIEDDIRNLKIGSPENEMGNYTESFGKYSEMELPDDLKKMNIKDSLEADVNKSNIFSFLGSSEGIINNSGIAVNVLSNEMEKLKVAREFPSSGVSSSHFNPEDFTFRTTMPIISKNPNESSNIFTGLAAKKVEFNAKTKDASRLKKSRGKLKKPVQQLPRQDFISRESSINSVSSNLQEDTFESYSPMDVSPYRDDEPVLVEEINKEIEENSREISVNDEDLVIATEGLGINDIEIPRYREEAEEGSFVTAVTADVQLVDYDSSDSSNDTFVTAAADTPQVSRDETTEETMQKGLFFSENDFATNFTFGAAADSQSSLSSTRQNKQKKKNQYKKIAQEYLYSEATSILSPRWGGQKEDLFNSFARREEEKKADAAAVKKDQQTEQDSSQEACDKWRLRGNQAYANGDMLRADEYYSQGINCISGHEKSISCLRALMLCYSNRAAARMSLGRVREALEDCKRAILLDPNFLRVQVRAANCYLALGDVEDASRHFTKCLQSDVCVGQKIALEASEGLEKSQRVSEWMKQSKELVQSRNSSAAESALGVISEALKISSYSEELLELKAEALFTLGKYEELIALCERTLSSAEINHAAVSDNLSFRLWRWHLVIKSYFYLGRLEDALGFLKKQEESAEIGSTVLESTTPLVGTIRELVRSKGAGNEAFRTRKYAEAVEHYSAALSSTVESRPFAAVCFCNRAAAYKSMNQVIDAIADCSIAIALDGNYLKAISRRASLFEMIRDYDQATKDLQREASLIRKQLEEKDGHLDPTDKLRSLNELRQIQQRQSSMEEAAKLEIPLNMYLILGVDPSSTASDIKKAYRKAALKHHPDKACQFLARSECIDDGPWKEVAIEVHKDADRIFKMIGEAYAILSDPAKRLRYDIDDETRNAQKRGFGGQRMHTDTSSYEREIGRSKQETWRTYGNSYSSRGRTETHYRASRY